ncbi:CRISPR-associated helicase Cas3' [Pseudonocardia sp. CA-107938]|uniref:CRISPR-associated helicase Cas3' n=1 Tax=Pseudonocardia sp. CA-107938 TaxID=3240021 RepID=UPI003D93161D
MDPLGVMWGKSNAGGSMHLLIAHLLDTAAVAELIWDRYLAPSVRDALDRCAAGQGRALVALVCGLHDVGKATPAFQVKDADLAAVVRAAGFGWREPMQSSRWHHSLAGGLIVRDALRRAGWPRRNVNWVWPLVAGHHGRVPGADKLELPDRQVHGRGGWPAAQQAFLARVQAELGVDLRDFADIQVPTQAVQLVLSGLVVMADWVASNDAEFCGISRLDEVSMAASRHRASKAWDALMLRGGWSADVLDPGRTAGGRDLIRQRFGKSSRASQRQVIEQAERMSEPGLLIVEAPMGEGKTEAALAAAEVLARRFGADGVFVGMPTQATSDPMFGRLRRWLAAIDPDVPVALLHGRSRFNKEWMQLRRSARFQGVGDEFELPEEFGPPARLGGPTSCCPDGTGVAAAEWFLGRNRGLLAPVVVATVDQLLHAATRSKFVMLRHAGLAGRVVVLDEVHAHDIYMSQFLAEALRWLAGARVPVVMLSATLPPAMRAALVRAYAQGATSVRDVEVVLADDPGYPRVTSVVGATAAAVSCASWRQSIQVQVEVLAEPPDFAPETVSNFVVDEVGDGGCALVICNTVARAQAVYREVRAVIGDDAVLLHARLTAATRADRTQRLVTQLGAGVTRPTRLVIVATQLAEQSFDVDVDLLVTDLAPIDLLLQRVGRLHRHQRDPADRPERMQTPRVVVSGVRLDGPSFPRGSSHVYGDHLLLRAAALVHQATLDGGWSVPAQVPDLVAAGYGDYSLGPDDWASRMATAQANHEWSEGERAAAAKQFLLVGEQDFGAPTLAGLHDRHSADLDSDEKVAAVVRDGDPSIEVVLVRREAGSYLTLAGRPIGPHGEGVTDDAVLDEVTSATVRLPPHNDLTQAALATLAPLSGWAFDPWLRRTRALVIEPELSVALGRYLLCYDTDLGLIVERVS